MQRDFVVVATILFFGMAVVSAQKPGRMVPVVRQVDHVLAESGDPKELFGFLADKLQLPVAWPMSQTQRYVSGGIGLGNVSIEIFRYSEPGRLSRGKIAARYSGLAFEPLPLDKALPELKARGVPYSRPEPYISTLPDGSRGVAWTTVALPLLSKPGMSVFLYEYSAKFLKIEVRRKQMGNRLILNNGGPLGVLSAAEITVSSAHTKEDRRSWTLVLGSPGQSGAWNGGTGPSIRLVYGKEDRIREIKLKVKSLELARGFLKKNRLLGSVTPTWIALSPSAAQGLGILLVQ